MPASYPGAVKTFATRSNGQTIDASHVNDLQDEVNAIESGILNGTAPVTCSNATVERLVVNQNAQFVNSSFSGSINIVGGSTMFALQAGNSTFAGLVVANGKVSTTLSSGEIHNYEPAGSSIASRFILTLSTNSTLTGIRGGTDGRLISIFNPSAFGLTLSHADGGSSGENRFILRGSGDIQLGANGAVLLQYDATAQGGVGGWRQLGTES